MLRDCKNALLIETKTDWVLKAYCPSLSFLHCNYCEEAFEKCC
jgi:hypothetical protein